MSKKLSTLPAGSLVKLNENGDPKPYIVLEYNHYGKGEVTLLRKYIFAPNVWCPGTTTSSNSVYNGNCLDMFCNTQHPLTLDPTIQGCLIDVPVPTMIGALTAGASPTPNRTIVNLMRHGFLLSVKEIYNTVSTNGIDDGTTFNYFNATKSNENNAILVSYHDNYPTRGCGWWTRSMHTADKTACYVDNYGRMQNTNVFGCSAGPRPALSLSSEILVSNSVDSDGCYTVEDAAITGVQYQKVNGVWRRMM